MSLQPEPPTDELGWSIGAREYHEALTKQLKGAVIESTREAAGDGWALELQDGRTFIFGRPIRADHTYADLAKKLPGVPNP